MLNTSIIEKENNDIINVHNNVENMIYEIRGFQVMLSSELSVTK